MKKMDRSITEILGCVVLVSASCVFAQDWPQWRGPNRDGKVSGFTTLQTWPKELTQKWEITVGWGDSTPALVGDKLYVFVRQEAEEVTLCLNAADGQEVWRDEYEAQAVTGAAAKHPGPRSSPTVADGRVVTVGVDGVVSSMLTPSASALKVVTLGVGGVLSCLDATSGKLVWRKDPFPKIVPKFFAASSPIIVDGMVIAHLGGPGNGAIIAYDLATGNEKWRWAGEGPDYGSPAILTVEGVKQIATPTEKGLMGIGVADGKLLWKVAFAPEKMAYNAATPIIDGQTVIYGGKGRGIKALRIEKKAEGFVANELWSNAEMGVQFNTPVLRDGLLFGLSDSGNLFCINAKTGQTAWTDATQRDRAGFGPVVSAGSCLLALPSNSELIVFKPDGKQYSEVARYMVAATPTYAHPVIAGNRIFVKDRQWLTLWTIDIQDTFTRWEVELEALELTSGGSAFGSVFLRGKPFPNCKVFVFRVTGSAFSLYSSATTNSAGVWKLKDIPPGKYFVGTLDLQPGPILVWDYKLREIRKRQATEFPTELLDREP